MTMREKHSIKSKTGRDELTVRREPWWERLDPGTAVGFRRTPTGGTWIARLRTPNNPKHQHEYRALKRDNAGNPIDDYPAAKKAAEAWFASMAAGARRAPVRGTVRDALDAYVADLRKHGRESAATDIEGRFKKGVHEARIASLRLDSVTRDDFEAWRDELRNGPRKREPRSVNRQVRALTAALNHATAKLGHVGNKAAWALTALSDDVEESGEAAVFLTGPQRERLISKAPKELRAYLRGLEFSGARPSELAKATVADFDKASGSLTLRHRKGRPARLKARAVTLSTAAVEFFTAQAKGRAPDAPLIPKDGKHWRTFEWSRGIRAAIEAANAKLKSDSDRRWVPTDASAYSFRHARISELLQVYNVDPLTVAQQTGTSLAMMEKYYFKFVPKALQDKLNAVVAA
jgi:integrase